MEHFDLEKALLEALSPKEQPKPKEKKQCSLYAVEARRAERDAARQEYRERIRHTDALVKSHSYTCTVCGKSAAFETVKRLSYITLDGGQVDVQTFKLAHGSVFFVEDGKPVMQGNPPFLVCSNECRRAWIRKYWNTCPTIKYWLKLISTIPRNVHLAENLAELKNESADEAASQIVMRWTIFKPKLTATRASIFSGIRAAARLQSPPVSQISTLWMRRRSSGCRTTTFKRHWR